MRSPENVLESLKSKACNKSYKYERLYRNLYNPQFYLLAYQRIQAKPGNMTAGTDGKTIDGMGMARRIRGMEQIKQPAIIFVTGYEKYVYDAFEVEASGYLVKPVNEQKFAEVFSRAQDKILSETEQKKKTLLIQYAGANKAIPLDHIYYMESRKHKVVLYTKDGEQASLRSLEYYAKIGELEEELQGQFCRIHKGYLVNLSCVDEYSRTEIMLANGDKLPLSKYKYEDFVKAYLHFLKRGAGL